MRLFLAAAAVLTSSGVAPAATPQPARDMPVINPHAGTPANCPATSRYEAARRGGKLPRSLLGELPGADLYMAVDRHVGRCNVPLITRYDIGGSSRAVSGRR